MSMSIEPGRVPPRAAALGEQSVLSGMITDEAELTAGTRVVADEKYGFFTDTTLCIGCKACEVACKEWNLLPAEPGGMTGHSSTTLAHSRQPPGGTSVSS